MRWINPPAAFRTCFRNHTLLSFLASSALAVWLALPMLVSAQAAQAPPAPPRAPALPPVPAPAVPPPSAPQVAPRFLVLLDAAHGGNDIGARLTPALLEKDLTLDLSNRLRSMLAARSIQVTTTRDSDATLPAVNRAETANRTPFAACILIHATATGSGVHLYTSSLAPAPLVKFMQWETAQSAYVTQSLKLSSDIDSALAHAEIPVMLGRTSIQPMDSFACPAVAVEIAPLQAGASTKALPISDESYQRQILDALVAAINEWRNDWRQQP
jgi:N-acetylmuramoyl-L-alanine amidase